jgi:hypothetical protein
VRPSAAPYGVFTSDNVNIPGTPRTARSEAAAAPDYARGHISTAARAADPGIFQVFPVRIIFSRFFIEKIDLFLRDIFSATQIHENNFQKS